MNREPTKGEPSPESRTSGGDEEPAVRERLARIQREKRAEMRWGLSRHTAERALVAISSAPARPAYCPSSKSRRRKRAKRLL
ncbi:MAG: hypothetical protein KGL93_11765 [Gemmatimonadota bacterium]|nr:hypothetical protein [Gemmatimonadota bacterium]HEU4990362.1 hypothetical protein [Gemmatimonadaceae bacterium]